MAGEGGFALERRTYFLGRRIRFCGWRARAVLRLFRRERARASTTRRCTSGCGSRAALGRLAGALEHHSYADLGRPASASSPATRAPARERRGGPGGSAGPLDVVLRPPLRFLRMYVLQLGVLDGFHGFLLCALAAAQVFLKYAELWAGVATGRAGPR